MDRLIKTDVFVCAAVLVSSGSLSCRCKEYRYAHSSSRSEENAPKDAAVVSELQNYCIGIVYD